MSDEIALRLLVADADRAPMAVSDDAVVEYVASAFARDPLGVDALRDAKLIAFLLGLQRLAASDEQSSIRYQVASLAVRDEELAVVSGISRVRVGTAVGRLIQAGVLEAVAGGAVQFTSAALRPAGGILQVEWASVLSSLSGHTPALLILGAFLGSARIPWEWTSLTYEVLARYACYSVGMAQRGIAQLIAGGVLERSAHLGRGHDYRLTSWALGRTASREVQSPSSTPPSIPKWDSSPLLEAAPAISPASASTAVVMPAMASPMVVEIGGLVVRVPVGTEIRMAVGPDGIPYYEVGPDLRITRRPQPSSPSPDHD